jgi:mono/diheme cytochrome c family protein
MSYQSHSGCTVARLFLGALLLGALTEACNAVAADTAARMPARNQSSASTGEYVARAADCMSCHTASPDKPFAGGNALKSAFGTIYGTNITSDPKTGIGTWTKADFERAVRLGVRKDGAYLYPAMPYTSYTKMSDGDMSALWEYIRRIAPIAKQNIANTLPFPLSVRSGMAVWQGLYFTPGQFVPSASRDAVWNRGAYLVQALGHCGDCHTPRDVAQGPESAHAMGGAQIEGWYAPDISNDALSKLGRWNLGELVKFLKTGAAPDNTKAYGPMQEVIHDSLQFLHDSDLQAMAVYLRDQGARTEPVTATKSKLPRTADGKLVYENNCSSCHQSDGKGTAGTVPALAGNDSVTSGEPYDVIMAILEGFSPQGTWGAMGSFAQTLTDEQISDVTNYVRTAWGNDASPNATPWAVGKWRSNASVVAGDSRAMLCPNLAKDVIQPALRASPDSLKGAARDNRKMSALIGDYKAARPNATKSQTVEALSTAYCRVLSTERISEARMSAYLADFAQKIAVGLRGSASPN